MEAASENTPKKKRGRPEKPVHVFSRDYMRENNLNLRHGSDAPCSERTLNNNRYLMRAMAGLAKNGGGYEHYPWLMGHDGHTWKVSLLTELGRIDDPEELLHVARQLCDVQPRVKDGIQIIRDARLRRDMALAASHLAADMGSVIDRYVRVYPDMTQKQVVAVLLHLLDLVESGRIAFCVARPS
jgi:hypothetical protein